MRHVLCRHCGLRASGEVAPANATRITPANEDGPAEFERFIWGTARDSYRCDRCNAPVEPGAEACCHSAIDAGRRIAPWEQDFLVVAAGC